METLTPTESILEDIKSGKKPEDIEVASPSLPDLLNTFIGRRDIPLSVLAELTCVNRTTLYRILSGAIRPGRNLVIRLGIELHLNFEEMQCLLKASDCAALSGTRQRDVYLINAVVHSQPIDDLNNILEKNGFEGIYTR